jgi:hypothetical protein
VTELYRSYKQVRLVVKRYVKGNWGYPFIAGFIVLLFTAAVLLAVDWTSVAEFTATCAYFSLAIGVILQLVRLGKNRAENGAVFHGSG